MCSRVRFLEVLCAGLLALTGVAPALAQERVPVDRLVEAMRKQAGIALTATTNAGRFQAGVYLALARDAAQRSGDTLLYIHYEDWFDAYQQLTGATFATVPAWIRLPYEHRQDTLVQWDRTRVIERVRSGNSPRLALNVLLWWHDPALPDAFEFEDRLSDPAILVRNERAVHFRLLDLGGEVVFDEVDGTRIRPLSGGLGVLFRIIGLAHVDRVRFAPVPETGTVVRGRGSKLFMSVATDAVIYSDGRAVEGIPEDRPDLQEVSRRLHRKLEIDYVDVDWDALAAAVALLR